jgi:peptidoglycan/LPS O-acetylase OafA/YrhL
LGLDLLRIIASLTIIAYHGSTQASYYNRGLMRHGYLAVDIFFVLSGYLLTRQALKMRSSGRPLMSFATRFWTRRWFRIMPAYWVVLALITLAIATLPVRGTLTPKDLLRHALFLQTLLPPNQYAVTWSLVTEEWFYLALPFVLFVFALLPRRDVRVVGIAAILLTPGVVRFFTVSAGHLPTLPQTRFDGLVIGAALGAVWTLAPEWKAALHRNRKWLFVVGCSGLFFTFVLMTKVTDSLAYWTVGILATNICVGMTIPSLTVLRWPGFLPVSIAAVVTFLSDLTYPLYLVHDMCYSLVDSLGIQQKIRYFAVALPLILVCAVVVHVTVERPFLAWRARLDRNTRRIHGPRDTGTTGDESASPLTEHAGTLEGLRAQI